MFANKEGLSQPESGGKDMSVKSVCKYKCSFYIEKKKSFYECKGMHLGHGSWLLTWLFLAGWSRGIGAVKTPCQEACSKCEQSVGLEAALWKGMNTYLPKWLTEHLA